MFKFVVPIVAMLVTNMPASIPDVLYDAKLSEAETVEETSCGSGGETVEEASCGSGVETAGEVSGSSGDNSVRIGQIYLPNGMLESMRCSIGRTVIWQDTFICRMVSNIL